MWFCDSSMHILTHLMVSSRRGRLQGSVKLDSMFHTKHEASELTQAKEKLDSNPASWTSAAGGSEPPDMSFEQHTISLMVLSRNGENTMKQQKYKRRHDLSSHCSRLDPRLRRSSVPDPTTKTTQRPARHFPPLIPTPSIREYSHDLANRILARGAALIFISQFYIPAIRLAHWPPPMWRHIFGRVFLDRV